MERMPAVGRRVRRERARAAKERPEEPAPWCVIKSGAVGEVGEVR
jgi:hypothetical protein